MAASLLVEFAYFTMSFRVCKFDAELPPSFENHLNFLCFTLL